MKIEFSGLIFLTFFATFILASTSPTNLTIQQAEVLIGDGTSNYLRYENHYGLVSSLQQFHQNTIKNITSLQTRIRLELDPLTKIDLVQQLNSDISFANEYKQNYQIFNDILQQLYSAYQIQYKADYYGNIVQEFENECGTQSNNAFQYATNLEMLYQQREFVESNILSLLHSLNSEVQNLLQMVSQKENVISTDILGQRIESLHEQEDEIETNIEYQAEVIAALSMERQKLEDLKTSIQNFESQVNPTINSGLNTSISQAIIVQNQPEQQQEQIEIDNLYNENPQEVELITEENEITFQPTNLPIISIQNGENIVQEEQQVLQVRNGEILKILPEFQESEETEEVNIQIPQAQPIIENIASNSELLPIVPPQTILNENENNDIPTIKPSEPFSGEDSGLFIYEQDELLQADETVECLDGLLAKNSFDKNSQDSDPIQVSTDSSYNSVSSDSSKSSTSSEDSSCQSKLYLLSIEDDSFDDGILGTYQDTHHKPLCTDDELLSSSFELYKHSNHQESKFMFIEFEKNYRRPPRVAVSIHDFKGTHGDLTLDTEVVRVLETGFFLKITLKNIKYLKIQWIALPIEYEENYMYHDYLPIAGINLINTQTGHRSKVISEIPKFPLKDPDAVSLIAGFEISAPFGKFSFEARVENADDGNFQTRLDLDGDFRIRMVRLITLVVEDLRKCDEDLGRFEKRGLKRIEWVGKKIKDDKNIWNDDIRIVNE